jgi:hypothetical protein
MTRSQHPDAHTAQPPGSAVRVTARDVARLDVLQRLLTILNDPQASAGSLARHVEQSSVLSARVEARFCLRNPNRTPPSLVQQIAILGNREIEALLLELLEDIIVFHSEIQRSG